MPNLCELLNTLTDDEFETLLRMKVEQQFNRLLRRPEVKPHEVNFMFMHSNYRTKWIVSYVSSLNGNALEGDLLSMTVDTALTVLDMQKSNKLQFIAPPTIEGNNT